jgi:hypothetical protein
VSTHENDSAIAGAQVDWRHWFVLTEASVAATVAVLPYVLQLQGDKLAEANARRGEETAHPRAHIRGVDLPPEPGDLRRPGLPGAAAGPAAWPGRWRGSVDAAARSGHLPRCAQATRADWRARGTGLAGGARYGVRGDCRGSAAAARAANDPGGRLRPVGR